MLDHKSFVLWLIFIFPRIFNFFAFSPLLVRFLFWCTPSHSVRVVFTSFRSCFDWMVAHLFGSDRFFGLSFCCIFRNLYFICAIHCEWVVVKNVKKINGITSGSDKSTVRNVIYWFCRYCFQYFHLNRSILPLRLQQTILLKLFPNPFHSMALFHSHFFSFICSGHHIDHRVSPIASHATHFAHRLSICLFWFLFWQFFCQVQDPRFWIFILSSIFCNIFLQFSYKAEFSSIHIFLKSIWFVWYYLVKQQKQR